VTIYEVFSGDSFGWNCNWILTGPDGVDIEKLWDEFETAWKGKDLKERLKELAPDQDSAGDYLLTRVFIALLCKEHGFQQPGTVFLAAET
jgi:hypothetical protein